MIEQEGPGDLVGAQERRHVEVRVLRLIEVATLALEPERRERAVVHAVASNTSLEVRHEREGVDGAEGAVAVTAEAHLFAIHEAGVDHRVEHGIEVFLEVARVVVVHLTGLAENRDIGFDERVALTHPQLGGGGRTRRRDFGELVDVRGIARALVVLCAAVFARIEPDHTGQLRARLPVAGQGDFHPELGAIARTRDFEPLELRAGDFRGNIEIGGELLGVGAASGTEPGIGDGAVRLARHDKLRQVIIERRDELFVHIRRAIHHPRAGLRFDIEFVHPRTRCLRGPLGTVGARAR